MSNRSPRKSKESRLRIVTLDRPWVEMPGSFESVLEAAWPATVTLLARILWML